MNCTISILINILVFFHRCILSGLKVFTIPFSSFIPRQAKFFERCSSCCCKVDITIQTHTLNFVVLFFSIQRRKCRQIINYLIWRSLKKVKYFDCTARLKCCHECGYKQTEGGATLVAMIYLVSSMLAIYLFYNTYLHEILFIIHIYINFEDVYFI